MSEQEQHIILVAFEVYAESRVGAQADLLARLQPVLASNGGPAESWWEAGDDRIDGSDNDSAVFVTPGAQHQASILLERQGLSPAHNIMPRISTRFEL
jgi:hypothetical protein